jgi:putative tryptophan/tyrosine transport system substrate-binding protein
MNRRAFFTLLGGAAAPWPLTARAQQPGLPVIGYLSSRTAESDVPMLAAVREGLGALGYLEGRNLAIEYRFADGIFERNRPLAEDLARRQVAVIVTAGNLSSALAAHAASSSIPIVFNTGVDPVRAGLVSSINRPGGNVTGVVSQTADLVGKMMGLLHELVPNARTIGVLDNPLERTGGLATEEDAQSAAAALGLQVRTLRAQTDSEIEASFAMFVREPPDALLIPTTPLFLSRASHIVELVARLALPAIYGRRPYAEAGGLMSYGDDIVSGYRQMGVYAGRILKGEKPAELPVVLSDKFELVINLKTARTLGLSVPPTLLALADLVIE